MPRHLVHILYTEIGKELSPEQYSFYSEKLPNLMRQKINRFFRWQDRQASLFGKLLLLEGFMQYGYPNNCLNDISIDKYGRPFLDDKIDFNISHSDEYVLCAISDTGRVGIDIERIESINLTDFKQFFRHDQFDAIRKAYEPNKSFYELWTRNESVIKADGKGLSIPFSKIIYRGKMAMLSNTTWFLGKIDIDSNYCCFLATEREGPLLDLMKVCYKS